MIDPQDIVTVSDLQDRLAPALSRARATGRPLLVTQRGKAAGVLLGIEEYTRLTELAERAELEEMIRRGQDADTTGETENWDEVKKEFLAPLQASPARRSRRTV